MGFSSMIKSSPDLLDSFLVVDTKIMLKHLCDMESAKFILRNFAQFLTQKPPCI